MSEQSFPSHRHGGGFLELQIANLLGVMEHASCAEHLARESGLLQRFDPRVRLVGMLILITLCVSTHSIVLLCSLLTGAIGLAILSRIPLAILSRGIWLNVAMFTGVMVLPAPFLVPGEILFRLPVLGWGASAQGIESAMFLICRATTAATFGALMILTTPWPHVLKALRALRVPAVVVFILCMTYRYIFLLLQTALDMFEARRSRLIGRLSSKEMRRMRVADAGVLLSKSLQLADEVFFAMQSRGYRGEMHALQEFRMTPLDWTALTGLLAGVVLAFRFYT